jgi:hypothetical protein
VAMDYGYMKSMNKDPKMKDKDIKKEGSQDTKAPTRIQE